MNENHPFVSIVIPVFNEEEYISACLNSLSELDYPREKYEITLVDNGSTDNSLSIASNFDVNILHKPRVKVGAVRNYGSKNCKGEIIVFLDSDCVVGTSWLSDGVKWITSNKYDAVGGLFLLRDNPSWIERNWILNSSHSFIYQNSFIGACIFIKKDVFLKVGGFNEDLNAGEDSALTKSLLDSGFKTKIVPELSVIHLGYPSTILGFIKRQIWHSSDYFDNLSAILTDKIRLLTFIYFLSILSLAIFLFNPQTLYITYFSAILLVGLPLILTFKRMKRYGGFFGGSNFISAYVVDVLYLNARVLGFIKGMTKWLTLRKNQKSYK